MIEWLHTVQQNYPDWMLFACLVKGKPMYKPFVTRVLEALLIAFIGALSGGYLAVAVSNAHIEEKSFANELRLNDHIAQELRRDEVLFRKLDDIQDCLVKRCNK